MDHRPNLDRKLSSQVFKDYYYLKEELVAFCKEYGLQATGSKEELTERITYYLDTGEKLTNKRKTSKTRIPQEITLDTIIEENFVCSQRHRDFYKEQIGHNFSFNVPFQKWLKANSGKTYQDSIKAYYEIVEEKKKSKTTIDKQFEYNTYIRDFFEDNKDKTLKEAIKCWQYKKSLKGHNRYEKMDLQILENADYNFKE